MKVFLYVVSLIGVLGLAYWAYQTGYETRATLRQVQKLERDLGGAYEELSLLQAEWAYLNRPDRLRELTVMNFERLELMELAPEQFGIVGQVAYPVPVEEDPARDLSELSETLRDIEPTQGTLGWQSEDAPQILQPAERLYEPELLP